jgi:uncharacterized protein YggE
MLKNTLYTILVIFLILLSVLVLGGISFGGYYAFQSTKPISSLNSTTTVKEKIKPNKATLNKKADEETKNVLKLLAEQGIEAKNIQSNKYSTKDYSATYSSDPTKIIEPKDMVVVDFTITFENLSANTKKPNEILEGLINNGITRYNPLNYQIASQEEICDKLESQALTKAAEKVRSQITELKGQIIRIEPNITQSCMNTGFGYPGIYKAEISAAAPTSEFSNVPDVQTGEIELIAVASARAEYR